MKYWLLAIVLSVLGSLLIMVGFAIGTMPIFIGMLSRLPSWLQLLIGVVFWLGVIGLLIANHWREAHQSAAQDDDTEKLVDRIMALPKERRAALRIMVEELIGDEEPHHANR